MEYIAIQTKIRDEIKEYQKSVFIYFVKFTLFQLAYQRKDHEDPGHLLAEQFDEFLYSEDESNLEEVNEFWMNFDGVSSPSRN